MTEPAKPPSKATPAPKVQGPRVVRPSSPWVTGTRTRMWATPAAPAPVVPAAPVGDSSRGHRHLTLLVAPQGVRLIALDVDGTLVPRGDVPSAAVVAGLHALRAEGLHVVLATGRELHNVIELCANLGADEMWAVCSNGAVTARITGDDVEVTEIVTFDPQPALGALVAAAPDLRFAIEEVGVGYVTSHPFGEGSIRGPQRPLDGGAPTEATLVICRSDQRSSTSLMSAISGLELSALPYDEGASGIVDLSAAHVSKATGVQSLARSWGVPASACVAVGDFLNDIALLRWAGWGVAMGHSPQEVLDAADAVVPGIDDDGLVVVLDALLGMIRSPYVPRD